MGKLKEMWKKRSIFKHIVTLTTILLPCCVIILSSIGLSGIVAIGVTNSIVIPILAFITLLNGIVMYKKNKAAGILILVCSGFIFAFCISVFSTKFLK